MCAPQMLDAILMPERMEPVAREFLQPRLVARMWPPEVASKPFVDFLKAQYDHTQLQAIEASESCHDDLVASAQWQSLTAGIS